MQTFEVDFPGALRKLIKRSRLGARPVVERVCVAVAAHLLQEGVIQRTCARHHEGMAGWRQVKRAVFARHSNPWSAWTRWASAPLVLVPVWRRSWRDAALVGVWMAVNPVLFGKPAHERAWATRAVLGEEQWIEDRPTDVALAVDVGASVTGVAALIAAHKRRAAPAAMSMATLMALLLWYWELMARYHDERRDR